MRYSTLCEIVSAVHLSQYVVSPFPERGGMFFVAPPGHLKTTAIDILDEFDRTLMISNLTNKTLNAMRQDAIAGTIRTICFADWQMIYRRHSSVAAQIEGTIMSFAAEGYRNPAFTDQRIAAIPARCTIIGAMTTKFFESKYEDWDDHGFLRRFLFPQYRISNPELLEQAIIEWRRARLNGNFSVLIPSDRRISYNLEPKEANAIADSLRFIRYDKKLPLIMAQKIVAVLKWKFGRKEPDKPMILWRDFAEAFGKNGAVLTIKEGIE